MYIIKTPSFTIAEETEQKANEVYKRITGKREYIRNLIDRGYHVSKAFEIANGQTTESESIKQTQ